MPGIPILKTKLYIPPARSRLVLRSRLTERLEHGFQLASHLTLLSAPAGFGKTTLLCAWIRQQDLDSRVAWLSMDEGDNNPERFWLHVVAALQTIPDLAQIDFGQAAPGVDESELFLTHVINQVTEYASDDLVLVLDDLHLVTRDRIHRGLEFLIDHLPQCMHLIVSSRTDPPWPLARWRVRGTLTELRAHDLRFTPQEATLFLNEVMELDLSSEAIAVLDTRTEGWIAGLQMASLAIQAPLSTQTPRDVTTFIQAFSGSHRLVLDYLVEEVLVRQPDHIREFLLRTAILDRMTASLCDMVTESQDGQMILRQLEQNNLFVVQLDDERRWYRYHHLFADLLHNRLQQTQTELLPLLHCRASEWYEKNGLLAMAVTHALSAGDMKRVAHLVAQNALTLIYHGELLNLADSLATLLQSPSHPQPWLQVAYAWATAYTGQLEGVEPSLQAAQETSSGIQDIDEAHYIEGHVAAIRAYIANLEGDQPRSVALARQALEHLSEDALLLHGFTLSLLATALRDGGDTRAAVQVAAEAVAVSSAAGEAPIVVTALGEQAILQIWQGQYHGAVETCNKALALIDEFGARSGQPLPLKALIYARLSGVHREWNDLQQALTFAREAVNLCELWGQADISVIAYGCLSSALSSSGDLDGAFDMYHKARQAAAEVSPWYGALQETWEASLRLVQGDVAAAGRWVERSGLSPDDTFERDGEGQYFTLARILIAQGKLDQAWMLLARLRETAEEADMVPGVIRSLIQQALVLDLQGKSDDAVIMLERALILAQPEGFVRSFINAGPSIAGLLRKAIAKGTVADYAGRLLSELEQKTQAKPSTTKDLSLVEPLSERELEVLRLLNTNLSSTEIAQELVVSKNTVRTHIAHIYDKLSAHSRAEALEHAQELDLL